MFYFIFIGLQKRQFWLCKCQGSAVEQDLKIEEFLATWLVEEGFFPTSPGLIRTAVSIQLLKLFEQVSLRTGAAITAFAGAMKDFYADDGTYILNSTVRSTPSIPSSLLSDRGIYQGCSFK